MILLFVYLSDERKTASNRMEYLRRLSVTGSEDCVKNPIMIGCYSKVPRHAAKIKTSDGEAYAGGVKNMLVLGKEENIIVGAGDGTIELVQISEDLVASCAGNKTKKLLILPCIITVNHTIVSMFQKNSFLS